ncbi:MAG: hypothetical protein IIA06_12095 [Proteobacteria bacterium]|nr:hypothetical protein [Pseudomonadota bacterium]
MQFITVRLENGQSYAGPRIEANSWQEAEKEIACFDCCQVTGVLDSEGN